MEPPFPGLRLANQPAGAVRLGGIFLPGKRAPAYRAMGWEGVRAAVRRATLFHHRNDLWNHIARPLNDDGVVLADIFPFDLVPVVQRGSGYENAAHVDRGKIRYRGRPSQAAYLDHDASNDRQCLLGGKLPGDGPAWRTTVEAQTDLPIETVDLHHDTIDGKAERGPLNVDIFIVAGQGRGIGIGDFDQAGRLIELEPPLFQPVPGFPLGLRDGRGDFSPGVGEKTQGAMRGDIRIQLAQASRGGVAGVGERFSARRLLLLVQPEEVLVRHVNFTAHLQDLRPAFASQSARDVLDGLHVRGHVLSLDPVASRQTQNQEAHFVAKRTGEAIDFRLTDEFDGNVPVLQFQDEVPDAIQEFPHVIRGEGVFQRGHRDGMAYLPEARGRFRAHSAGGAVRKNQVREGGLDRAIPTAQDIVFGVRDLRLILLVIEAVVMGDFLRQFVYFGGGLFLRQLVRRNIEECRPVFLHRNAGAKLPPARRSPGGASPRAARGRRRRPWRRTTSGRRAPPCGERCRCRLRPRSSARRSRRAPGSPPASPPRTARSRRLPSGRSKRSSWRPAAPRGTGQPSPVRYPAPSSPRGSPSPARSASAPSLPGAPPPRPPAGRAGLSAPPLRREPALPYRPSRLRRAISRSRTQARRGRCSPSPRRSGSCRPCRGRC